jgi:hypothetical protein
VSLAQHCEQASWGYAAAAPVQAYAAPGGIDDAFVHCGSSSSQQDLRAQEYNMWNAQEMFPVVNMEAQHTSMQASPGDATPWEPPLRLELTAYLNLPENEATGEPSCTTSLKLSSNLSGESFCDCEGSVKTCFVDTSPNDMSMVSTNSSLAGSAPSTPSEGFPDVDSDVDDQAREELVVKNTFLTVQPADTPLKTLSRVKTAPGNLDILKHDEDEEFSFNTEEECFYFRA